MEKILKLQIKIVIIRHVKRIYFVCMVMVIMQTCYLSTVDVSPPHTHTHTAQNRSPTRMVEPGSSSRNTLFMVFCREIHRHIFRAGVFLPFFLWLGCVARLLLHFIFVSFFSCFYFFAILISYARGASAGGQQYTCTAHRLQIYANALFCRHFDIVQWNEKKAPLDFWIHGSRSANEMCEFEPKNGEISRFFFAF